MEKADVSHVEKSKIDLEPERADEALEFLGGHAQDYSEAEAKAVLRKIDWRLTPILVLVNCI